MLRWGVALVAVIIPVQLHPLHDHCCRRGGAGEVAVVYWVFRGKQWRAYGG